MDIWLRHAPTGQLTFTWLLWLPPWPPFQSFCSLFQTCRINSYLRAFGFAVPSLSTELSSPNSVCLSSVEKQSRSSARPSLYYIAVLFTPSTYLSLKWSCFICLLAHCLLSLEYNLYYSNNYILCVLFPASRTVPGHARHSLCVLNEWMHNSTFLAFSSMKSLFKHQMVWRTLYMLPMFFSLVFTYYIQCCHEVSNVENKHISLP